MTWKRLFQLLIVLLGVGLLLDLASRLGAEILWFQEVRYLPAFLLKLQVRLILMSVFTGFTALYLLGNLTLAHRLKYPHPEAVRADPEPMPHYRYVRARSSPASVLQHPAAVTTPSTAKLQLRSLLPLTVALSLLAVLLLLYYGQLAIQYWQTGPVLPATFISRFNARYLLQAEQQLIGQIALPLGVVGVAIALLVYPRLLGISAFFLSILLGWLISKQWAVALQYLNPTAFNATDPLFGRDIGFYIFSLPLWELLELWLFGLFLYGFIAILLTYLLSGDSLSQGTFPGFSSGQQRHLYGVGGALMLAIALSYWLSRFELLYSPRGVAFGASYTDATAQLPIYTVLSILALAIALYLLGRTVFWQPRSPRRHWVSLGLSLFGVLVIAGVIAPEAVQYLVVQPNELAQERPFIERTIALTRQAFGLEAIDSSNFDPQGQLTKADLAANNLTIRNIRLWDQRPLLQTNRQLQQIRPYYRFPDADIDRYTLQLDAPTQPPETFSEELAPVPTSTPTEQRQVLIAARELDYSAVPQEARTWVNRHLIYTHGFGFTLSPVNTVGAGGLPEYFVKDITGGTEGALTTSSPAIRASIPIGMPRIYYGEISNTYVMTETLTRELDFPSGSDNAYNVYSGRGGINMGSWWRRALFAVYLRDWRILFTRDFLPETKVLFRRNIKHRIQAIAPFLRFDSDPYLVTANARPEENSETFLYWIVDAYTTSDRYPYSDPGNEGINYIRNSVKVVVDAYHGSVDFYVADSTDPMISTWSKAFPGLFKPLSAMPASLQSHLRYPVDFFKLQSDRLMTYHMTDPQVFYNREDQWQIPNEIYGDEARPVEPYYLITSLPAVPFEEFILLLPYTPRQRTNLIAWLAARSDGTNYGRLLLYTFPKERLVFGPEQIEARINQDPVISQQISLWNRQGSRAIQGNLLIIPIEQSLLYVEPLYLEATQNSLPTLVRVIVAYENRIVMAPTLEEALRAIFSPKVTPGETIIRSFEEPEAAP